MGSLGKKLSALLVAIGVAVLPAQTVSGKALVSGTGTFADQAATATVIGVVDGDTLIRLSLTSRLDGVVSGTRLLKAIVVVHPDGAFTAPGTGTCACTIGGHSGTWFERFTATGVFNASVNVHVKVRGGTEGLNDLHAVLIAIGYPDPNTGLNSGTYTINYHFSH